MKTKDNIEMLLSSASTNKDPRGQDSGTRHGDDMTYISSKYDCDMCGITMKISPHSGLRETFSNKEKYLELCEDCKEELVDYAKKIRKSRLKKLTFRERLAKWIIG